MTFFRELPVGVLAAAMAITLSACTININSGNPAATEATPMDEEKAQVLACKVHYDHFVLPLRSTGNAAPSLETLAESIGHQEDAIAELSDLPGEVAGVLMAFHKDWLSFQQWRYDTLAKGEVTENNEFFTRLSAVMKVPDKTRDFCLQYFE
jgi:hypothetical protein